MRHLRKAGLVGAIIAVGLTALLFLLRSHPVLLRIPLQDATRPRSYCLMNPFRNRAPETVAEAYLTKLREGRLEVISSDIGGSDSNHVLENEKKWPIQS